MKIIKLEWERDDLAWMFKYCKSKKHRWHVVISPRPSCHQHHLICIRASRCYRTATSPMKQKRQAKLHFNALD